MKRILQAIDGVATKPVAGANDMAKFLRVVKEANVEYLPPDPEVSAQLRAQSQASMDADGPKHQANTFIRFSSGMYDQSKLPKTMTIKPGVTLPIKFNPIKNMDGDVLANAIAANKLLPPDLQYSSAELSQVVGQNAIQETPEVLPAQQPAPVQENSLNKFLSIVKQNDVSILNEGANPHKVSLPVQMAMQHYQQPKEKPQSTHKPVGRETTIGKYFHKVEDELAEQNAHKRQLINQYASTIAERVIMREGKDPKLEKIAKRKALQAIDSTLYKNYAENMSDHSMGFKPGGGGDVGIMPNEGMSAQVKLSRAWDREKAKSTASIERAKKAKADFEKEWKEKQEKKSQESNPIKEANAKKRTLKNSNPCWKGYHPVGTKKKGKRTVPNCVPKE